MSGEGYGTEFTPGHSMNVGKVPPLTLDQALDIYAATEISHYTYKLPQTARTRDEARARVKETICTIVKEAFFDAAEEVVDMVDHDPQPIDAWLRKLGKEWAV